MRPRHARRALPERAKRARIRHRVARRAYDRAPRSRAGKLRPVEPSQHVPRVPLTLRPAASRRNRIPHAQGAGEHRGFIRMLTRAEIDKGRAALEAVEATPVPPVRLGDDWMLAFVAETKLNTW